MPRPGAIGTTRKCSDDDGGEGCDAKWSETFDIAVTDGTFGCTDTISVTVTCEWDAQGEIKQARGDAAARFNAGDNAGCQRRSRALHELQGGVRADSYRLIP